MKYLVVIDMQNDFIDGSLGTKEAVAILPAVEEKAAAFEGEVLFTFDTHQSNYLETQEGKHLPVLHCIDGSEGWMLPEGLTKICRDRNCLTFSKPTFGSADLAAYFKEKAADGEVESIELCGLCTDICVISNALILKAVLPEVPIYVDPKLCAGVTPESHENAIKAMSMCQILIKE